jgi:hypothetical protein
MSQAFRMSIEPRMSVWISHFAIELAQTSAHVRFGEKATEVL